MTTELKISEIFYKEIFYELEKVEWLDCSGGTSDWISLDDIKKRVPVLIHSIGYIVKETDRFIIIVPHIACDPEENYSPSACGELIIPLVNITKRFKLYHDQEVATPFPEKNSIKDELIDIVNKIIKEN